MTGAYAPDALHTLRESFSRRGHRRAKAPAFWLGQDSSLTSSGLAQVLARRSAGERALAGSDESLRCSRELGNRHAIGLALAGRAAALALLGRMGEARPLVIQAIQAFDEIGDRTGYLFLFEILAVVEATRLPPAFLATMVGAVDAGYPRYGLGREPSDDRLVAGVRGAISGLDAEVRDRAAAQGAAHDARDAIGHALRLLS